MMSMLPVLAIFAIFYFLVIRPQRKQMKEHEKMLEGLKKGDRLVTTGGLFGTVTSLRGPELDVRISDNVVVTIARSSVARLAVSPAGAAADGAKA
jgi:preprotein translocase subunit YajC